MHRKAPKPEAAAPKPEVARDDLQDCASSFVMKLINDTVVDESEDEKGFDVDVDEDMFDNEEEIDAGVTAEEMKEAPKEHSQVLSVKVCMADKLLMLRHSVMGTMLTNLRNGLLTNALEEVAEAKRRHQAEERKNDIVLQTVLSGLRTNAAAKARTRAEEDRIQQEEEQMKADVRKVLMQGLCTGKLHQALQQTQQPQQEATEVEDLRCEVRDLLVGSTCNGKLAATLSGLKPTESPQPEAISRRSTCTSIGEQSGASATQDEEEDDLDVEDQEEHEAEDEDEDRVAMRCSARSVELGMELDALDFAAEQVVDIDVEDSEDVFEDAVEDPVENEFEDVESLGDGEEDLEFMAATYVNQAFSNASSFVNRGPSAPALPPMGIAEELSAAQPKAESSTAMPDASTIAAYTSQHMVPVNWAQFAGKFQRAVAAAPAAPVAAAMPDASTIAAYTSQHMVPVNWAQFAGKFQRAVAAAPAAPVAAAMPDASTIAAYASQHMVPVNWAQFAGKFKRAVGRAPAAPVAAAAPDASTIAAYASQHMVPLNWAQFAGKFQRAVATAPAAPVAAAVPDASTIAAYASQHMVPLNFALFAGKFQRTAADASATPVTAAVAAAPEVRRSRHKTVFAELGLSPKAGAGRAAASTAADAFKLMPSQSPLGELKGVSRGLQSSPSLRCSSPAGRLRPHLKDSVASFRMDASDDERVVKPTMTRQSSFTSAFDALGKVDFHCMADSDVEPEPRAKPLTAAAALGPLVVPAASKMTRTRSRAAAAVAASSAMALDLGLADLRPGSSGGMPSTSLFKSSSTSTLRVNKSGADKGFLPSLSASTSKMPPSVSASSSKHKSSRAWNRSLSSVAF